MSTVGKQKELPLYYQVEHIIRQRILDGTFAEGQKIPAEAELEKEFNVSRITIRRAIDDLVQAGLLRKRQGVGTIVTKNYINDDINSFEGFTEKMERQGRVVTSTVLEVCVQIPPEFVLEAIHLPKQEKVLKISRVRNVDGVPLAVFNTYLPLSLGIDEHEDFSHSLFELYARHGIEPAYSDRTIRAIVVNKHIGELLHITEGDAALQLNYLVYDVNGNVLEYDEGIYRGDWYQYKMRIYRKKRQIPLGCLQSVNQN